MASGARSGCGFFLAAAILAAAVIGVAEGKAKLRTGKIQHVTRGAGAAEWWDAVTGKDEHGDLVTTFMHKRWGTALQLYHSQANSFLPFRFVPHLNWLTRSESGHAQGVVVTGEEVETVNYWYAAMHLEELNAMREADTFLPDTMDLGSWKGEQIGESMLFSMAEFAVNLRDDGYTDPRYVILLPDGFIYMGADDTALTVRYDNKGNLLPPIGVGCALEEGIGYFSGALDLSEEVLPQLLGVPKNFLTGEMKQIEQTIREWSVKRRANNPFARMLSPKNYKEGKDGVWEWCGKGTGSFMDGSLPYGE